MKKSDELKLRERQVKGSLGELSLLAGDALTDTKRAEMRSLTMEHNDLQLKINAAEISESAKRAEAEADLDAGGNGDGSTAEIRSLERQSGVVDWLVAGVAERSVDGAPAEFAAALSMPGPSHFPVRLIAPRGTSEMRATTTDVDTGSTQRNWLDRLTGATRAAFLGVGFQSVEPGIPSFTQTLTGGSGGKQRGRNEDTVETAWTIGVTTLEPARHQIRWDYTKEDAARIPGLAAAIERDMRASFLENLDKVIFKGDDGANENRADIKGFFDVTGLQNVDITQAAKIKNLGVLAAYLSFTDGLYSEGVADTRSVVSVETEKLWSGTIETASTAETQKAFLQRNGVQYRVRRDIDDTTAATKLMGAVSLQRGLAGAAVAPVWTNAELLVDPYTDAGKGTIRIFLITMWNWGMIRTANFAKITYVA